MVTADVDVMFESRGPVYYHGHWLTYGIVGNQWEIRCSVCEDYVRGQLNGVPIDREHLPLFWLYKFYEFRYECENAGEYDSWRELIMDEIKISTGKVADQQTKRQLEEHVADMMIGDPSVDVTFNQP